MMLSRFIPCILSLLLSSTVFNVYAEPLHGHVKLQQLSGFSSDESINSFLDQKNTRLTTLDIRAQASFSHENWEIAAEYELTGQFGSAVEIENQLKTLFPQFVSTREDSQWFDLDHDISESSDSILSHRLDRLSISYSESSLVARFGRQALTWGNGLVFHPMDLFNPFSPDAVDTSYKPGTDMVYGQWLFTGGSDISALIVPRRNPQSNDIQHEQSSAALKWHYFGKELQADVMLATDYDDAVAAIGINGPLGEAAWRFDIVPVFLEAGGSRTSLVANIDTAWIWAERNYSGYLEYFRNGFGLSSDNYTLADLPPELAVRLLRGQAFNTGRDYLSGGFRIEMTALLQLNPLLIFNLNDDSALLFISGIYSLDQDMTLDFGTSLSMGSRGTEYGGIETLPGSGLYSETSDQVYARLSYFY